MKLEKVALENDLEQLRKVSEEAFSSSSDASLDRWFSFPEMVKAIGEGRGIAVKAVSDDNRLVGLIYAQQESPINGPEGLEKWVIVLTAVDPEYSGHGIGSSLLNQIENQARQRGARKMFVYTNIGDERVIDFYKKNGYQDAGWIKDYQYGKDNSAVFLLKYLDRKFEV